MSHEIYIEAVDILNDFDNYVGVTDLNLMVNDTLIDVIELKTTTNGDYRFVFYAGNPTLDCTDEEEYWEELILTDKEEEAVLKEFVNNF